MAQVVPEVFLCVEALILDLEAQASRCCEFDDVVEGGVKFSEIDEAVGFRAGA